MNTLDPQLVISNSESYEEWQERLATMSDQDVEAEYRKYCGKRGDTNKALWRVTGRNFQATAKRESLRQQLRGIDYVIAILRSERLNRRINEAEINQQREILSNVESTKESE